MKAKSNPIKLVIESTALAAVLALGVAAGCEKKDPAKPTVPKPPAPDVTPKATSGGASASSAASASGGASVTSTPTTRPTTQASAGTTTKPGTPTIDAPLVTSTESAKHSKDAQELVGKAMQALKDSRFDECKSALDKVDAMGKDVPHETRELSTTTRAALNKAQKLQTAPDLSAGDGPNK